MRDRLSENMNGIVTVELVQILSFLRGRIADVQGFRVVHVVGRAVHVRAVVLGKHQQPEVEVALVRRELAVSEHGLLTESRDRLAVEPGLTHIRFHRLTFHGVEGGHRMGQVHDEAARADARHGECRESRSAKRRELWFSVCHFSPSIELPQLIYAAVAHRGYAIRPLPSTGLAMPSSGPAIASVL